MKKNSKVNRLEYYWKRTLKLEHELKEKTELAARLMEEAEKWKGKTEKLLEFVDLVRTATEQGVDLEAEAKSFDRIFQAAIDKHKANK